MKNYITFTLTSILMVLAGADVAFADGNGGSDLMPIGVGLTMGIAVIGGALGQGKAVSALFEAIGRNPSAAGKLNLPMFVGLAFIEALVILAFVIAGRLIG